MNNNIIEFKKEFSATESQALKHIKEIVNKNINLDNFLKLRKDLLFSKPMRIVVVDDNINIMKATCNIIKKVISKNYWKFELLEGRDGLDTLKYIIDDFEGLIKIVFTDDNIFMF